MSSSLEISLNSREGVAGLFKGSEVPPAIGQQTKHLHRLGRVTQRD